MLAPTPYPVGGREYPTHNPRQEGRGSAPRLYRADAPGEARGSSAELYRRAAAFMARARDLMRAAVEAERQELERAGGGR